MSTENKMCFHFSYNTNIKLEQYANEPGLKTQSLCLSADACGNSCREKLTYIKALWSSTHEPISGFRNYMLYNITKFVVQFKAIATLGVYIKLAVPSIAIETICTVGVQAVHWQDVLKINLTVFSSFSWVLVDSSAKDRQSFHWVFQGPVARN